MSMIQVSNLTFGYFGSADTIFDNVSFMIDTNWKTGFIGRNGRGKTTFAKLLLGKYEYQGTITASVFLDYFPFKPKDSSQTTFDIVDSLLKGEDTWRIYKELSLLKVPEEVLFRPFQTLSQGEQSKVLLAALFLRENHFLFIDEPTNHLDLHAREIVCSYLKKKKGFLLVSHDRAFLDGCIDHVLSINKNNIEIQKGNYTTWYENKKRQDNYEQEENKKLKKEIRSLTESARKTKQWAEKTESLKIGYHPAKEKTFLGERAYLGEKSRRMQQRRKNLEHRQEKAISEKESLLKNIETQEALKITPLLFHKERILQAQSVSVFYGARQINAPLSFTVSQKDRVCLKGKNGCGKSSILKILLGEGISYTGQIQLPQNLKISYVSQDTSFLKGNLSDFAKSQNIEETLFKTILRKLDFSREQFQKDMEFFSEGQKKKVLIAKSLSEQAHLYIWDEPLNFIDVLSKEQIEDLILNFTPTMLFVEHDQYFVEKIATKVIEFS